MPDLLDQLHDYGDALESRVQVVTAAEVMDVDRRPAERAQRRSRRLWIVAASAAAIAVLVAGTFAVVQRGNQPFAGTGPVPPAQLRATLVGHDYRSTSVTEDGSPRPVLGMALDTDPRLFLSFHEDRLDWGGGCNGSSGGWDVVDGRLVLDLERSVSTAAQCQPVLMEQDNWFSDFLMSSPTVALDGDRLTLTSPTIVVELLDQDAPAPEPTTPTTTTSTPTPTSAPDPTVADEGLVGHNWLLDHVEEGTVSWSISPDIALNSEGPPSIMFVAEAPAGGTALVSGHDGCTGFIGAYGLDGSTITFGPFLDNTIGGCPSEDGDKVAAAIQAVLDSDPTFVDDGDELRLSNADRTLVFHPAADG